jgi:glutathione S-transferase
MVAFEVAPNDPAFPAYQQFLHLGEASLAASIYFVVGSRNFAPEAERQNWSAGQALRVFESRLTLVTQQLARSPYLAGEMFTAADISVTYALVLGTTYGGGHARQCGAGLSGPHERTRGLQARVREISGSEGSGLSTSSEAWTALAPGQCPRLGRLLTD